MKVLIFTTRFPPENVGTARYVELLAGGLTRRGVELKVLAPAYRPGHPEDAGREYPVERIAGGNVSFIPLRYQRARAGLRQAVARWRPDAVWAANGMATRVAGTLLGELGMPLLGTVHGTDVARRLPGSTPWTWLESVPQRRFYQRARRLLTNSAFTRQLLIDKGIDGNKVQVVHLGVELPAGVEETRASAPARHPEWQGRPLLLTVGRLVQQKGHRLLLQAMRQVADRVPRVLHLVVGDGPEQPALARQIEALGLRENVLLLGRVSEAMLRDCYALAWAFALTSHEVKSYVEGMGFVFLEAAAWGVPAVGTRHGGITEAIEEGQTGFLVPPAQPEQIGLRLAALLADEGYCRRLGRQARTRVEQYFNVERMAAQSEAHLREVVG
ncbi:MAG: glycosyltransferase family 4 protein [Candidatus Latescibacteria bacterium]|nr:glycosyltransferase family 4 protein [Candidatus Latescibacterota bacterium]